MKNWKYLGLGLLGGTLPVGALLIYQVASTPNERIHSSADVHYPVHQTALPLVTAENAEDFTYASELTLHSVVHVTTKVVQQRIVRDPLLEFFYGPGVGKKENLYGQGAGSGVIVSSDGYIVTNNHVIADAAEIEVTLNNNEKYTAEVIGTDPSTDLAVLKIEATNLPSITIGNSDEVKIGEWVLAVGNPFNLTSTVTAGIVSAKSRNINILRSNTDKNTFPIESFIQTDAAVNPGNSGGALVNTRGELIGINTAIASQTGSYSGYSFAIPVNLVAKVMSDLMSYGVVQRGFLGIRIADINQELMVENKLPNTKGVFVADVIEKGAAEKAGIKKGDVLLKIGQREVSSTAELLEEVGRARPGEELIVTLRTKDGKETTKNVVLQNKEGETSLVVATPSSNAILGATFSDITPKQKKELGIDNGLVINSLSPGKLKSLGLEKGMVITRVNNERLRSVQELKEQLEKKSGGILLEIVTQSGKKEYIGFGL
jgi:Do/DeqQ family serine protease